VSRVTDYPIGYRVHDLIIKGPRIRRYQDSNGRYYYPCQCICGKQIEVRACHIPRQKTCGCSRRRAKTHGRRRSSLYKTWLNMKQRCSNPNADGAKRYFARGISVCAEWRADFVAFENWAISNGWEAGLQLDRIDNDGHYEPANCRWVNSQQNNCNRHDSTRITAFGITQTASEWELDPRCVVTRKALIYRIYKRGWNVKMAITTPATPGIKGGGYHHAPKEQDPTKMCA
jgi:hypothetical protein